MIAERDSCGAADGVIEHTGAIDGRVAVDVGACDRCRTERHEPLAALLAKGCSQKIAARRPKVSRVDSNVVAQPEEHYGEEDCGGEARGQANREKGRPRNKQLKARRGDDPARRLPRRSGPSTDLPMVDAAAPLESCDDLRTAGV